MRATYRDALLGEDLADFSNTRLHAPNFEGAKITDGSFYGADISGDLEFKPWNSPPPFDDEKDTVAPRRVVKRTGGEPGAQ